MSGSAGVDTHSYMDTPSTRPRAMENSARSR